MSSMEALKPTNFSIESLLIVLIIIVIIQTIGVFICKGEGFTSNVDYDKYQAAYNQEHDNVLGATEAGNPLNKKVVSAWSSEGLVGSSGETPAFWDGRDYNMYQQKGEGGVVSTTRPIDTAETFTEGNNADDVLTKILHGQA